MPLSIDGMNIGMYSNRPVNFGSGYQTSQLERTTPVAQRLNEAQERLQERQRLEQERQERLREAREERIEQQELREEQALQTRLEREEADQARDEQLREQRLETLQEQRDAYFNPLSAENMARQRTQLEVGNSAATNSAPISPRLAAQAIATYRQTESPDFISRSLVA